MAKPAATVITDYLKKTWVLWAIVAGTLGYTQGDLAQFAALLYLFGPVSAVLLVTDKILDHRDGWGLFPGLNLTTIFRKGQSTPISSAIMFLGLCFLLSAMIVAAALVLKL